MINSKIRKTVALPNRVFRLLLYFYFRFDKWHINTLYERKYANDIVRYLNARPAMKRNSIAEIGCGLGDLLRNLKFLNRTGYDIDLNALRAARFLSRISLKKEIQFEWFKFPDS